MKPIPACWKWREPDRAAIKAAGADSAAQRRLMAEWQAGWCAICGRRPERLVEDHDHATAITRGFLCYRCNTAEACRGGGSGVFAMYRECNPAIILGVSFRYVDSFGYEAVPDPPFTPEERVGHDAHALAVLDRLFPDHPAA